MTTSGIEEAAMRLLGAFYDLSGHNPAVGVPLGAPGGPNPDTATETAGLSAGTTEADVALRYLVNQHYVTEGDAPSELRITVMGIDRIREVRGLD